MHELTGRLIGYVVLGLAAGALLIYTLNRSDGLFGGDQDAATSAHSRNQLKLHDASVKWRQKLLAVERRNQQLASASHALANDLRTVLAQGTRTDTVQVLVEVARQDSTAFAQCSVALLSCQQRAASAELDADSLSAALKEQLKVKDHRCGVNAGYGYNFPGWSANVSVGCRLFRLPLLP